MPIIVLSNHTRIGAWVTRKCRGILYNIINCHSQILLRKASEARVDRRLRRYYLIILLLPIIFTLACLPLSSI